jgi:hypothetical protein
MGIAYDLSLPSQCMWACGWASFCWLIVGMLIKSAARGRRPSDSGLSRPRRPATRWRAQGILQGLT